jgi:hypothetical protein
MSLEDGAPYVDVLTVMAVPFWIAAAGGFLLAVASITSRRLVEVIGGGLFVLGAILFFVAAVSRSAADGVALTAALRQGAGDAMRFAWHLMP